MTSIPASRSARATILTRKGERPAYFPEWAEKRPTPVYDRYALSPGATLAGPAIVEERESTLVVGPHNEIEVTPELALIVTPRAV